MVVSRILRSGVSPVLTPKQARELEAELLRDSDRGHPEAAGSVPDRIGQFRVRRVIGGGGMGTVYEAEQERPRRTVAVKILRRGVASPGALRRFEHEVEVLGHLRHPGIAQVYGAGTYDDGSGAVPYFAMEYVSGAKPITRFADERGLSIRRRLELFARVCDAVHYGHQKGIIHRDLKPENILVGEQTGAARGVRGPAPAEPEVKVIDFGVAKATDSDLAVTTIQTDAGALVGTLQYMSPEQCDVGGDDWSGGESGKHGHGRPDLDTRSDVYSLGVVLYELVTGHVPYDVSHKSLAGAARLIQEAEPPPPGRFRRALRGDIETIVLTSIAKDREKRYQSAAHLAQDIGRHLRGEPIDARPPTAWARAVRRIGRHPIVTTVVACAAIAVLTFLSMWVAVWWYSLRPDHVEIADDRSAVRLVSAGGQTVHRWTVDSAHGIANAELIKRPAELGGGRFVVIAFMSAVPNAERLVAYPAEGHRDIPLWSRRVATGELPPELAGQGLAGEDFWAQRMSAFDIFERSPGKEIVVWFKHGPRSLGVMRIYSLAGDLLYQIWQDGGAYSLYWLADAKQIVAAGLDATAYWEQRGRSGVQSNYPKIVFAVRPVMGHVGSRWACADTYPVDPTLCWYKCILPAREADHVGKLALGAPTASEDAGRFVRLNFPVGEGVHHHLSLLIDEFGVEHQQHRVITDQYRRNRGDRPDPDLFRLDDLPPITDSPAPSAADR
jgi:serine/threonine protein kinase